MRNERDGGLREKFSEFLIHTDEKGSTYLDEQALFNGEHKLTPDEFNTLIALKPPITVDYILEPSKKPTLVNKIFSFKLPIEQTLALWSLMAVGMFYMAPNDKLVVSAAYGFFSWFAIEQLYHRAGHLTVKTEDQMRFIYQLHWKHHLEPDRPGATVSPIAKNFALAVVLWAVFSALKLPNPLMAMGVLTLQYNFYEFTHWLSHSKKANEVAGIPVVGRFLSDVVGHHREHHRIGDRFSVSTGSFLNKLQQGVNDRVEQRITNILTEYAP